MRRISRTRDRSPPRRRAKRRRRNRSPRARRRHRAADAEAAAARATDARRARAQHAGTIPPMMGTLRRYFVAGLLVWIPLGITLWVLTLLVDMMDQSLLLLPERYRSEALFGFHVPGLGIILTVAIVLATGALAANLFGRKILALGDAALTRIPIVRSIYGGVKQISDTLFSPEGKAFRRAVLI